MTVGTEQAAPRTVRGRTVPDGVWISVLALLTAVAPLATDMYLPVLPTVAAELGTSASASQLTLTAFLVGLAVGQLVIGPLSDSWGRRRLVVAGTVLLFVACLASAVAPSVAVLVVARFLQGFGGAAGLVLSRAMISDRTTGARTAQLFSLMMAINGIAPVVAPVIGSSLGGVVGWRGIFVVLAGLALLMLVSSLVAVHETLPVTARSTGGVRRTFADVGALLRRRRYVGYVLAFATAFSMMFAYISGSPFVLQQTLGLSTTQYALAFGANAAGLVLGNVVSGRLAARIAPRRQLVTAVGGLVVLCAALLVVALLGAARWPVLVLLFATLTTLGFVMGNSAALATGEVRDRAGAGSALLGATQFGLGALVSPLVGSSATAMAVTMLTAAALSAVSLAALTRGATAAD
ncbi:Multidrug resistance transporter, Bcr/CflA family [Pseudonocardia sp. Ae406_Ps2]|uniref:multidrug effflux MFS transporter n=1 Tax=unclassified Pseudonocardia TaxID=2619320 RepID=UPI00094B03B5|nr:MULTISPECIES: multidrug effflux MFS transporter [unclassified Pseudonocardia]OLL99609.1 Multidrug resistance transporter, Bcr/CflA family [Pseudonocardia sp. Ae331_Ps2]OLM02644.1 Multidrug resistance transporter, Bcr/CflA family [Pseudonocardia sp. Ae406_Ps2]OLM12512.1 Multidrug resistance transporter, Bcr/CflA family [Pseudonocardia sp. Ae505_Ps2]OLM24219.1 Multidrug resistance transporter, Bcr/CflA family [Pseudonocardia sp. Ae706_Ps2]OLM29834.1 Multidrug resistance transporter, Bcr/CflA 